MATRSRLRSRPRRSSRKWSATAWLRPGIRFSRFTGSHRTRDTARRAISRPCANTALRRCIGSRSLRCGTRRFRKKSLSFMQEDAGEDVLVAEEVLADARNYRFAATSAHLVETRGLPAVFPQAAIIRSGNPRLLYTSCRPAIIPTWQRAENLLLSKDSTAAARARRSRNWRGLCARMAFR